MAVAYDAFTASGDYYATPDPATLSHTPSGTPRGVVVWIVHVADFTDDVTAVTYGGTSMTKLGFASPGDSGEDVGVSCWFLGSSVPTGTQTVSVDHDGSGGRKRTYVATLTAAADTEATAHGGASNTASTAAQVTLDSSTTTTVKLAALATGRGVLGQVDPITGMTELVEHDLGSLVTAAVYRTTPGSGSETVGWTLSANDEWAVYGVAVGEVASNDRAGEVSWAELELPNAPRRGEISWAELELPDAPRAGEISWAELEIPNAARQGRVSWVEMELPDAPRRGQVTWAELELPDAPRAGTVSWAELEVPDGPRAGIVSWAELEIPTAPRAGRISWAELELGDAPRRGEVSWAALEIPDVANNDRRGIVSWAELETGDAARAGRISWAEMEIDNAPRRGQVTWAELELGDAARAGLVTWAEMEIPTAPRAGIISWAELEVPSPDRQGYISWAALEVPSATSYTTEADAQGAIAGRILADGGTPVYALPADTATLLGVTNTGEVLGNLRAAGATAASEPEAIAELLGDDPAVVGKPAELNHMLRRLAEEI